MEISLTIDKTLHEYYIVERNMNVPSWKRTEPQWWIDYLDSLGLNSRNS